MARQRLPANRPAAGSVSDIARVNRVEGVTVGFGGTIGLRSTRLRLQPSIAYGTGGDRVTGSLGASWSSGTTELSAGSTRNGLSSP